MAQGHPVSPTVVALGEILWDLLPAGKQLGGAPANFAFHAGQLGATAATVSAVGDDPLGREILARLNALGVDARHIAVDPAHPTGTVTVELNAAGQPSYTIHENVAWDHLRATPPLLDLVARADCICFGSLAQRSSTSRQAIHALLAARRAGALTIFDINLRQHFYSRDVIDASLRAATLLKINDEEVITLSGLFGGPAGAFDPAMRAVSDLCCGSLGIDVAVTRGARGALLYTRDEGVFDHPGYPADPLADTIGAGDAFTAALAVGLLRRMDLPRVLDLACRVASFVCTQPGATPVLPGELVASFSRPE